jgi:hypothetical protein
VIWRRIERRIMRQERKMGDGRERERGDRAGQSFSWSC